MTKGELHFTCKCFIIMDYFFFQAEDGIRDGHVTGVQTCALPISGLSCEIADFCASSATSSIFATSSLMSPTKSEIGRASCREREWNCMATADLSDKTTDTDGGMIAGEDSMSAVRKGNANE